METEVLEGDALASHIDKLGSEFVSLTLEGRLYRNVQNKQNIAVITARLGEFVGIGFSAKASIDPDLGDDATVLLAVGRSLEDLGNQIKRHIFEGIESTLAHKRFIEAMRGRMRKMEIVCDTCEAPKE